jgi:septum formation protein
LEQKRKIILASASPQRKELLEKIGLKFQVDPSNFPENLRQDLPPEGVVKFISIGKASTVAVKYPDAIIIAADTIGVLKDRIIGKPHTSEEASKMLQSMSGKIHRVITGLTLIDTSSGKMLTRTVETKVRFKKLSPAEIQFYVQSGEPQDKAGGYAIQGMGALIVEKISGDYYNVVGLPLSTLADCLKEFGVYVLAF